MSLILYHSVESTCSQKVRFVLSEKKLAWEQVNLNLRKGEQFREDYLKLNPKAVVPTLVHGDEVIRESTVIIEYLDDVFPEPAMRPESPVERARMRLLLKAFDEEVHPSVGILSYAIVLRHQMNDLYTADELESHFQKIVDPGRRQRQKGTHSEGLKSASAATARDTLVRVMQLMGQCLKGNSWLAGSEFSLADACAVPYVVRIRNSGLAQLWQDSPLIGDWLQNAVNRVADYGLSEPWGSESFHAMVAAYVENSREEIQQFLAQPG